MAKIVSMEIPKKWLEGIPDDIAVIQHVISLGIRQYKIDQALNLYKNGGGSIGYAAEIYDLSKADLIQEAQRRGIEPGFTENTVREERGS